MICAFLQHPLIIKNDQYQKYDGETKSFTALETSMTCLALLLTFTLPSTYQVYKNMLVHELNISPKY